MPSTLSSMVNYRRNYVNGGSYFFTVVTDNRAKILCSPLARACLRKAVRTCQQQFPFESVAWVLLEDHLHTIWTLPKNDTRYSARWGFIKKEFTKVYLAHGGNEQKRSNSRQSKRERGIWQRRFWEHTLQDEHDMARHFDYIHYNAVKHGVVNCAKDYGYSTFHKYVELGIYDKNWGCDKTKDFVDISTTVGE